MRIAISLALLSSLHPLSSLYAAPNIVTLRNRSGAVQVDYPLQIGRPFGRGEIGEYPQAGICADRNCASRVEWLPTQADVKTRWSAQAAAQPAANPNPGASVKFAVIALLIPRLPSGAAPVYLTFRNQATCNCGRSARLSKEGMLDPAWRFDARIAADFGTGAVVRSARDMLAAWDEARAASPSRAASQSSATSATGTVAYWQEGSIATTVILADHSAARTWDFGADRHRSLRPIFHVTFWPAIRKICVRAIVEASNSEAAQDQTYSVTVTAGDAAPWHHDRFTHTGFTSWSRSFWIGGAPTDRVDIDYNLGYLTSIVAVPNFDTRRVIPKAVTDASANAWRDAPKDLYEAGSGGWPPSGWQKAMGSAGGRPDIGPYPRWHVQWLYTGDYRMRQYALGLTELASAWPTRIREANSAKYLDRGRTVAGLGYPVSISTRPTTNFITGYTCSDTRAEDRVRIVGPLTDGGWRFDVAHQPDPWSISYMLTGDPYYLEQGQFWAFYSAHRSNGAAVHSGELGRGPTGAEGGLDYLEIRAQAWMLRGRVEIAELTPDDSPVKGVLKLWINDAIAQREGAWKIEGTRFHGDPNWNWGRQYIAPADAIGAIDGVPPPPGIFKKGDHSMVQANYGLDPSACKSAFSLFETSYFAYAIGRAAELGYPAGDLVRYLGRLYIHMATSATFNPFLLQSGRYPTVNAAGAWYANDGDLLSAWWADGATARNARRGEGGPAVWRAVDTFPLDDAENGYEFLAASAISFLTREPGGAEAWNFASRHIVTNRVQDANPKWAILPRGIEAAR